MTDLLTLVRAVALQLPGAKEGTVEGGAEFAVEGCPFARVVGDALSVLGDESEDGWIGPEAGADPSVIEDMVAHGWELAAPAGLLEAGGR